MRRLRGENVYPSVALSHRTMHTKYGDRERPHLDIKNWVRIGAKGIETIGEPNAREATQDQIPF
jgi:hypothetical protein